MPSAAPKPCTHPGCGVLVRDGSGRCEKHQREAWTKKPDAPRRVTGRRLQAERADLFRRQPLCVLCQARGIVRLATERDHIVPLSEGGEDVASNTQGLCADCHEGKSLAERLRAQARARGG
ncbi:MAG: HNH endonuclease signature motif containing protein [Lysobacteraceae bacterium]